MVRPISPNFAAVTIKQIQKNKAYISNDGQTLLFVTGVDKHHIDYVNNIVTKPGQLVLTSGPGPTLQTLGYRQKFTLNGSTSNQLQVAYPTLMLPMTVQRYHVDAPNHGVKGDAPVKTEQGFDFGPEGGRNFVYNAENRNYTPVTITSKDGDSITFTRQS